MGSFEGVDLGGFGTSAGQSFTTPYLSEIGTLPAETSTYTTQMTDAFTQAGTAMNQSATASTQQVVTTANSGLAQLTSIFNQGRAMAISTGSATGIGYASGIQSGRGRANSAGNALKSTALSAMSGGYGRAYSHGSDIGQGLADGMWSKVGSAWAAASELAAAADKAIAARAQIGSPSKITRKYGRFIASGLAIGMNSGTAEVVRQAEMMTSKSMKAVETMVNIPKAAGSIAKAGSFGFTSDQIISEDAEYVIVVKAEMDGREVAEVIAPYSEAVANRRTVRQNRKQGVV